VKEKFPGMGENCARKKQFFPRFINILHRLWHDRCFLL
jgi:hypothetical protein